VPQQEGGAYFRFPTAADFAALPVPIASARDYAQVLGDAFAPVFCQSAAPQERAA
jgi:hypothetical protein